MVGLQHASPGYDSSPQLKPSKHLPSVLLYDSKLMSYCRLQSPCERGLFSCDGRGPFNDNQLQRQPKQLGDALAAAAQLGVVIAPGSASHRVILLRRERSRTGVRYYTSVCAVRCDHGFANQRTRCTSL